MYHKKVTIRQRISRYFDKANGGFITARRICKTTGYSYAIVMKYIGEMVDEGEIYRARCWSSDGNVAYCKYDGSMR